MSGQNTEPVGSVYFYEWLTDFGLCLEKKSHQSLTDMRPIQTADLQWRKKIAKLKLMFVHLDDSDFRYDYGMKEAMMTKLQAKLVKSRKELNALLAPL